MQRSKLIIVVGCGRLGGMLANSLSKAGHQMVVVDRKHIAFDKLSIDFSGYKIVGDAVERHILEQARVGQADYLFATTTEDNINLMVAQVAKVIFNVPKVVARVYDPNREKIYREFGIETVSPTILSSNAFMQLVE
jgi:trk system potassium uptake protein TrkA